MNLIYDEDLLTVFPTPPGIESILTYTHKELIYDFDEPSGKRIEKRKVKVYSPLERSGKVMGIQTHSGFVDRVKEFLQSQRIPYSFVDVRKEFPKPRLDLMHGFRFSQKKLLTEALEQNRSGLIGAPTRYGKCLNPDTLVLMADGSMKKASDIVVGDFVMAPDSTPKKVLRRLDGEDEMWRILPNKGDPWECTRDHILVLQCNCSGQLRGINKGDRIHVSLQDYLKWPKSRKHIFKQVQASVEFPEKAVPFDPYMIGLFLGDGIGGVPCLSAGDRKEESISYMYLWGTEQGYEVRSGKSENAYRVCNAPDFREYWKTLCYFRRIPEVYRINSREVRLQLLAGFLDSDGNPNNNQGIEWTNKSKEVAEDLVWVARSLGFRANIKEKPVRLEGWDEPRIYHRVGIYGPIQDIPLKNKRFSKLKSSTKFNPLTTGFEVEKIGTGPYSGMEIEGDTQEFVLGNFTITHNSYLLLNIIRAYPTCNIVVLAPGEDLIVQNYEFIKKNVDRDVVQLGGGSRRIYPSEEITVCSMDSMHKLDHGSVDLVIIDEPHALVTEGRSEAFMELVHARKIGLGATLEGRFDGRDIYITGLIGPVLSSLTFKEAVAEGAVCPVHVMMLDYELDVIRVFKKETAYKKLFYEHPKAAQIIGFICNDVIPKSWQALTFIKNERHGEFLKDRIAMDALIMAKKCSKKKRKLYNTLMVTKVFLRVLATKMYSTGVTFSHLMAMINAEGGGAGISTVQKGGRLAEVRPNKACGVLFDFRFTLRAAHIEQTRGTAWEGMVRDSKERQAMYERLGYEVHRCRNVDELKETYNKYAYGRRTDQI